MEIQLVVTGIDRLRTGCIMPSTWSPLRGNTIMVEYPAILKVLCAGLVGCLLLPLGSLLFPYLDIPPLPFNAMEAVVGGFGIAKWLG
jgi:hypothetical protein